MHTIEPHYFWREGYIASEDTKSPMYGRTYEQFSYTQKIYNYLIHPQWDYFGSTTLYLKILWVDYNRHFAVIEFIGEWNDCISNDIMLFKRNVAEFLEGKGIFYFILIGENVLNYHVDEDSSSYYEEWYEELSAQDGWAAFVNIRQHIESELSSENLHHYVNMGDLLNRLNWRTLKPLQLFKVVNQLVHGFPPHIEGYKQNILLET